MLNYTGDGSIEHTCNTIVKRRWTSKHVKLHWRGKYWTLQSLLPTYSYQIMNVSFKKIQLCKELLLVNLDYNNREVVVVETMYSCYSMHWYKTNTRIVVCWVVFVDAYSLIGCYVRLNTRHQSTHNAFDD